MLFSTPLRTGVGGRLRPGLCTSWRTAGKSLRLHCSHADAIAAHLRRATAWEVARPAEHAVVVRTKRKVPDLPYLLTEPWSAPPGVPGPFRLISASPRRVVVERKGLRVDVRKLAPFAALKLFRAGRLDEAPVPLGDIRATKLDPQLAPALHVRRLLAADAVVFSHSVPPEVLDVYDDTADRADYQALVPEFEAPPAESLAVEGQPSASQGCDRAAGRQEAHSGAAAPGRPLPAAARPDAGLRQQPARRRLARPRPWRGRGRWHGGGAPAAGRAVPAPPRADAARPGQAGRPDRLGRRCPSRLTAPARLARGRARLGRLRPGQTPGSEPTPVTSKRAVAIAGERSPVG